jgi:hypothetical protein
VLVVERKFECSLIGWLLLFFDPGFDLFFYLFYFFLFRAVSLFFVNLVVVRSSLLNSLDRVVFGICLFFPALCFLVLRAVSLSLSWLITNTRRQGIYIFWRDCSGIRRLPSIVKTTFLNAH